MIVFIGRCGYDSAAKHFFERGKNMQQLRDVFEKLYEPAETKRLLLRLQGHWIETPEQLIATIATAEGKAGMCRLLEIPEAELDELISKLTEGMDTEEIKKLQSDQPGGERGLRLPDEEANG